MKTVADVNVLFAILVAGHLHHDDAWKWWQQRHDQSVALCWPTRLGVLRLLTNGKAMGGNPVSPETALAAWQSLSADPRCIWMEPQDSHEVFFRRYVTDRQPSPNLWNDAWLGALAESQGHALSSFDADFRSFKLSHFEHLKHAF